jgi:hypothetical protein
MFGTRQQNKKWAFMTRRIWLVASDLTLSLFSRLVAMATNLGSGGAYTHQEDTWGPSRISYWLARGKTNNRSYLKISERFLSPASHLQVFINTRKTPYLPSV